MSHAIANPNKAHATCDHVILSPPSSAGGTFTPIPQCAPGASAAVGHTVENSIPLSIFPIGTYICFLVVSYFIFNKNVKLLLL